MHSNFIVDISEHLNECFKKIIEVEEIDKHYWCYQSIALDIDYFENYVAYDNVIRPALITRSKVTPKEIKSLRLANSNIENLSFAKGFYNLEYVHMIYQSKMESLNFIATLRNVKILVCAVGNLKSLEALRNWKNLKILNCSGNKLSSLESLENMKKLKKIDCSFNLITSLKPLRGLSSTLEKIECYSNDITSLRPLKDFNSLKTLDCSLNSIAGNLVDLSKCIFLKKLFISYTHVDSIKGLPPNVKYVEIEGNSIGIDENPFGEEKIDKLKELSGTKKFLLLKDLLFCEQKNSMISWISENSLMSLYDYF